MKIKKFVAPSMQEAIKKVKTEMGSDAVILYTRNFRQGGMLGFFGKEMVEVTAAVEQDNHSALIHPSPPKVNRENLTSGTTYQPPILPRTTLRQAAPANQPKAEIVLPVTNEPPYIPEKNRLAYDEQGKRLTTIYEELQELKRALNEFFYPHQLPDVGNLLPGARNAKETIFSLYQNLCEMDVDEKLACKLLRDAVKQLSVQRSKEGMLIDSDLLREALIEKMVAVLKSPAPIKLNKSKAKVVALVGPTGVGKTTTIAKLAAKFALEEKRDVALITTDTYRIAAVEQLKTYAEIIGIPLEVVFNTQELDAAITRNLQRELILIDTAGRGQKNALYIQELKAVLNCSQPIETYLVISATTRYVDMVDIFNGFSKLNPDRLVITKVDETSSHGAILSIVNKVNKSLAYLTNGQNVPDDIEVANPQRIANMILRVRQG